MSKVLRFLSNTENITIIWNLEMISSTKLILAEKNDEDHPCQ
jgi:hypothetical protein